MHDATPRVLSEWSNFYVITGSSAAALTGLMFVVVTLVTGEQRRSTDTGMATFSTPTVVHFCAALLVSAVLSAPWHWLWHAATVLGITGLYGVIYVSRILAGMWKLAGREGTAYTPERDDWIWYVTLPMIAYVAVLLGAIAFPPFPSFAAYGFATATLLLIFIGIHNSWDIVTYLAIRRAGDPNGDS